MNLFYRTIQGVVTTGILMSKLVGGKVKASDPVEQALYRQFCKIKLDTSLGYLSQVLEKDHFVLIVHTQRRCEYFIIIIKKIKK
jgi:cystathionine beta-synthase